MTSSRQSWQSSSRPRHQRSQQQPQRQGSRQMDTCLTQRQQQQQGRLVLLLMRESGGALRLQGCCLGRQLQQRCSRQQSDSGG